MVVNYWEEEDSGDVEALEFIWLEKFIDEFEEVGTGAGEGVGVGVAEGVGAAVPIKVTLGT